MTKSDASGEQQQSEAEHVAEEVFSSEKREDIWALIIAMGICLLSVAFPGQIYHFFTKVLYLFSRHALSDSTMSMFAFVRL